MNTKIEMPDFLPPLPPVPEGYDRWEYRGIGASRLKRYAYYCYEMGHSDWVMQARTDLTSTGVSTFHYLEAVKGMPDNLPPHPPVPEGYDRWEYRGMGVAGLKRYAFYSDLAASFACWGDQRQTDIPSAGVSCCHYIEAVKDEPQEVTTISEPDMVNSPPHYQGDGIECIDAIRAALTPEEFRGYCKGNGLKYIWREPNKGGDQDIAKAAWYLNKLKEEQP
jgi:hypothetical protein